MGKRSSYHINIAGVHMDITAPDKVRLNHKIRFFCIKSKKLPQPDVALVFKQQEDITIADTTISLDTNLKWATNQEGEVSIYLMDENRIHSCMRINNTWNHALILTNKKDKAMISHLQGALGEIFFRNCLLNYEGIVIHAAAITCKDKGIIFSAPSGTGKTTQANLWRKYKGARIINADRPAIRVIDEIPYIYGTLWNGSSSKYTNAKVRLHMIVMVEQAHTNEMIKLSGKEAVGKVMPRCFLPYCTHEIMDLALKNIEKIIGKTPVYLLKCRPDKEAVELVSQCLE